MADVDEGKVVEVPGLGTLRHPNVDSCVSITCICDDAVIGGHAVMFSDPDSGVKTLQGVVSEIHEKTVSKIIRRVFLIGNITAWLDSISSIPDFFLGTNVFTKPLSTRRKNELDINLVTGKIFLKEMIEDIPTPVSLTSFKNWISNGIGFTGKDHNFILIDTGGKGSCDITFKEGRVSILVRKTNDLIFSEDFNGVFMIPLSLRPQN